MEQLSDIAFDHASFWVKAYNVPAVRQTWAFAKFPGDKVGAFVKYNEDAMMGMDKTLCFRAEIDLSKSLRRGVMVKVDGKAIWIKFKYLKRMWGIRSYVEGM